MIERETAVRIVEEQLEIDYPCESAGDRHRMVVLGATEHELVRIVGWPTEEYARTRDVRDLRNGDAPAHLVAVVTRELMGALQSGARRQDRWGRFARRRADGLTLLDAPRCTREPRATRLTESAA
ncbi:hypothetical protein [Kitasatospora griseola]|uniref:hypothetical protein n=1 Tax=Kitasatospora griseola TaxID=2064 RepID=UPI0037FE613D